jgi:hypothetical protein
MILESVAKGASLRLPVSKACKMNPTSLNGMHCECLLYLLQLKCGSLVYLLTAKAKTFLHQFCAILSLKLLF